MIKRFFEWIQLKTKLHERGYKPPFITEGDIWWAGLGENIGQEIDGKGINFARPVYVYKKFTQTMFLAIPMTTKIKQGSWFVSINQNRKIVTLCLQQIRTLDSRRLDKKLGSVDEGDRDTIYHAFNNLYIKQKPYIT